ncbi:DUF72 domain-containing protein [Luteimonas sp. SDU101]|uniref:DUF72 domain-containing protein n=1 Tax=Luteimonas sp. SDU101 TaxID=3422593 RepID=UPI003EB78E68
MAARRIRIGCAGWSIGTPQRGLFDDGTSMLARYATRFDVVEVNSSFYRPHRRDTWRRWAESVPARFRFSAKLPRTISHELGLRAAGPALDSFLSEVDGLGGKLGALLLQLPPSLALEPRSAGAFFRMLRRRTDVPVACEPRHASWFDARATALLQRHAVTRVAADPARLPEAACPPADASWSYWRWHGSPRIYYSRYEGPALAELAAAVASARAAPAWVIFDNTAHGHAVTDALRFQTIAGVAPRIRRRSHA